MILPLPTTIAMYELSRTVRFTLSLAAGSAVGGDTGGEGNSEGGGNSGSESNSGGGGYSGGESNSGGGNYSGGGGDDKYNTYAGYPSMAGIGVYYELEVRCRGEADPQTGYVMNISKIDEAVRELAIPIFQRAVCETRNRQGGEVLLEVMSALASIFSKSLISICWRLTPYYGLTLEASDMDRVIISQHFDFAAAHRLHCPDLSDEENREVFGRCNNPNGHGHNYRLRVDVATELRSDAPSPLSLPSLEKIVDLAVIQHFDHTHLNLDTPEFADLNPSVEHIARICHGLLQGPIEAAGGELQRVTVWETERTSCTYPAPGPR